MPQCKQHVLPPKSTRRCAIQRGNIDCNSRAAPPSRRRRDSLSPLSPYRSNSVASWAAGLRSSARWLAVICCARPRRWAASSSCPRPRSPSSERLGGRQRGGYDQRRRLVGCPQGVGVISPVSFISIFASVASFSSQKAVPFLSTPGALEAVPPAPLLLLGINNCPPALLAGSSCRLRTAPPAPAGPENPRLGP